MQTKIKFPIFRYFTFLIVSNILVQELSAAGAMGHVVLTVTHTSSCFGLVFPVKVSMPGWFPNRLISKPNTFLRATIMAVIACTLVISVFNT